MKWSQLKKRIEGGFADSVRGRVEVWTTRYRDAHDDYGEAWITVDRKRLHSMGTLSNIVAEHYLAARLRSERGCADYGDPAQYPDYLAAGREAAATLAREGTIASWDFNAALFDYLNKSIEDILASDDAVTRGLGMLDRRVGKRRLREMRVDDAPPLVRALYGLRCAAEGILTAGDRE